MLFALVTVPSDGRALPRSGPLSRRPFRPRTPGTARRALPHRLRPWARMELLRFWSRSRSTLSSSSASSLKIRSSARARTRSRSPAAWTPCHLEKPIPDALDLAAPTRPVWSRWSSVLKPPLVPHLHGAVEPGDAVVVAALVRDAPPGVLDHVHNVLDGELVAGPCRGKVGGPLCDSVISPALSASAASPKPTLSSSRARFSLLRAVP